MVESLRGFLAFLRAVDLRIFQEREVGLDVYLSGFTGLFPLFLGIAGTYRQNDSVDLVYQAGGRREVVTGLPIEPPETRSPG